MESRNDSILHNLKQRPWFFVCFSDLQHIPITRFGAFACWLAPFVRVVNRAWIPEPRGVSERGVKSRTFWNIRSNSGSDGCNIRASTRNKDKNSISCPDAKICHMSSKIVAGARWSIVFFHNRFAFLQKLDLFDNPVVQPSDRGPPATGDSKISKMEATRIDFFFNER